MSKDTIIIQWFPEKYTTKKKSPILKVCVIGENGLNLFAVSTFHFYENVVFRHVTEWTFEVLPMYSVAQLWLSYQSFVAVRLIPPTVDSDFSRSGYRINFWLDKIEFFYEDISGYPETERVKTIKTYMCSDWSTTLNQIIKL